jgi:hypothetical protein
MRQSRLSQNVKAYVMKELDSRAGGKLQPEAAQPEIPEAHRRHG